MKTLMQIWTQCPVCRSADVDGDLLEIEGQWVRIDMTCHVCGATWLDEYFAHGKVGVIRGVERSTS